MDPDLQKLFEEFNKLAEDLKSEDINKLGNQLKMSVDDFQKQLDRNLQLLERYEIEVRVKQLTERINKLAEDQDISASKYRKEAEKIKQDQKLGQQKWNELKEDLKDVLDKNSSIQKPYDFDGDLNDLQDQIDEMIQESNQLFENNKIGKGAKNMKKHFFQTEEFCSKVE